ncbi:MAG: type II secretion system F family protein [Lachnospiraceae bacterium]|nr:type II secretion system F family protein [Lachnospiraceae bacterium]
MSVSEWIRFIVVYGALAALIAYTFYDSPYALIPLMLPGGLCLKKVKEILIQRRKRKLADQFKDLIDAVNASMQAGFSAENAFREAYKEMAGLYGNDALISVEVRLFISRLDSGVPLEHILKDFALRAGVEDITDFADVFSIAKRNGGNIGGIIKDTVRMMKEKEETDKEIRVILSGRKLEQKIMCIIPFLIIIYLRVTSRNFFGILYHDPAGAAVMTLCLLIMGVSCHISQKLVDIRV